MGGSLVVVATEESTAPTGRRGMLGNNHERLHHRQESVRTTGRVGDAKPLAASAIVAVGSEIDVRLSAESHHVGDERRRAAGEACDPLVARRGEGVGMHRRRRRRIRLTAVEPVNHLAIAVRDNVLRGVEPKSEIADNGRRVRQRGSGRRGVQVQHGRTALDDEPPRAVEGGSGEGQGAFAAFAQLTVVREFGKRRVGIGRDNPRDLMRIWGDVRRAKRQGYNCQIGN